MNKLKVALNLVPVLLVGGLAALPAYAASYWSTSGQDCPSGYGCVYGNGVSRGWNIGAGDTSWYSLSGSNNAGFVRNRNGTSQRTVVLRNAAGACVALIYDNRGWVATNMSTATAMRLTEYRDGRNLNGCTSTRWL